MNHTLHKSNILIFFALLFVHIAIIVTQNINEGAPVVPDYRLAEFSVDSTRVYRGDIDYISSEEGLENQAYPLNLIETPERSVSSQARLTLPSFVKTFKNITDVFSNTEVTIKASKEGLVLHSIITQTGTLCGTISQFREGISKFVVCGGLNKSPGVRPIIQFNETSRNILDVDIFNVFFQGASVLENIAKAFGFGSSSSNNNNDPFDQEDVFFRSQSSKKRNLIGGAVNLVSDLISNPSSIDLSKQPLSFILDVGKDLTIKNIYDFAFNVIKTVSSTAKLGPGDILNKNSFCTNVEVIIEMVKSVCIRNTALCVQSTQGGALCSQKLTDLCDSPVARISSDVVVEACKFEAPTFLRNALSPGILTTVASPAINLIKGIFRSDGDNRLSFNFEQSPLFQLKTDIYRPPNQEFLDCICSAVYEPRDQLLCDVRTGNFVGSTCQQSCSGNRVPPEFLSLNFGSGCGVRL